MKVLYFSTAESHAGTRAEELSIAAPITLGALWDLLIERHPGLAALRDYCMVSSDEEFVRGADTLLEPSAEIALLPPFSGG